MKTKLEKSVYFILKLIGYSIVGFFAIECQLAFADLIVPGIFSSSIQFWLVFTYPFVGYIIVDN